MKGKGPRVLSREFIKLKMIKSVFMTIVTIAMLLLVSEHPVGAAP